MPSSKITIDAEAVELRLPEDRRIHVKTPRELERIAGIVRKPVIHELVNTYGVQPGSEPAKKGSHLYAVYDGPWVYYCEVQAEEPAMEGSAE